MCWKAAGRGGKGEESEEESKESEREARMTKEGGERKYSRRLDLPKVPPLHCQMRWESSRRAVPQL